MSSFNTVLVASTRMCLSKCSFVIMSHNIIFTFFLLPKIFPTFFFSTHQKILPHWLKGKNNFVKKRKRFTTFKMLFTRGKQTLKCFFLQIQRPFSPILYHPLTTPPGGDPNRSFAKGGGGFENRAQMSIFSFLFFRTIWKRQEKGNKLNTPVPV